MRKEGDFMFWWFAVGYILGAVWATILTLILVNKRR